MTSIDLDEWKTVGPSESSDLRGLIPRFDNQTEQVALKLADSEKLEILQLRSGVQISTTSWVGRITLGDLTVTVHPKITGLPLLNLLRYAYSLRDLDIFTPTNYSTAAETFQDLVIEQLATETTELLSRGLHRDYLRFNEELPSPIGRINFNEFVHAYAAAKSSIVCTYFNRSEAILLNRVLLAGLRLASRVSTDSKLRARIWRLEHILEASIPSMYLHRGDIEAARRVIDRRSTVYSSAVTLIEMLVNGLGISLTGSSHDTQLRGFLFDMNAFFQALISRFLREELPEFTIRDEHRLTHVFEYEKANGPRRRRAVVPRPDFALFFQGRVVEFLDAKYRDLWANSLPRDMLYQLAIYALSKTAGVARSTILYPTLDTNAVDQTVRFKDPASGQKRAEVVLRPVNLTILEGLINPRRKALVARRRKEFARRMAFGGEALPSLESFRGAPTKYDLKLTV